MANDLKKELAEEKGFSERNLKVMVQFYSEYPLASSIGQLSVAQLENAPDSIRQLPVAQLQTIDYQLFTSVGWPHHIILIQKIKDLPARNWYMQQILEQGWTRDTLVTQIKSNIHERQGVSVHNFERTLPDIHSNWAKQVFKDSYIV